MDYSRQVELEEKSLHNTILNTAKMSCSMWVDLLIHLHVNLTNARFQREEWLDGQDSPLPTKFKITLYNYQKYALDPLANSNNRLNPTHPPPPPSVDKFTGSAHVDFLKLSWLFSGIFFIIILLMNQRSYFLILSQNPFE